MTPKQRVEAHVTNLTLSKRLKELGVTQKSLFYWMYDTETKKSTLHPKVDFTIGIDKNIAPFEVYSAFLASELGEKIGHAKEDDILRAYGFVFNVPFTETITPLGLKICITDVNVLAKMLIYLLENKLL